MSAPKSRKTDPVLAELDALTAVINALTPLSPDGRERVLRSAAELIDVWQPVPKSAFPPKRSSK